MKKIFLSILFSTLIFFPENSFSLTYDKKTQTRNVQSGGDGSNVRAEIEGFFGNASNAPNCKKFNYNLRQIRQGLVVLYKNDTVVSIEKGLFDCSLNSKNQPTYTMWEGLREEVTIGETQIFFKHDSINKHVYVKDKSGSWYYVTKNRDAVNWTQANANFTQRPATKDEIQHAEKLFIYFKNLDLSSRSAKIYGDKILRETEFAKKDSNSTIRVNGNLYWSNSKTGPSTVDEAKKQFGNRKLNFIEGIWYGDSLGTVFIIKDPSENRFKLFIINLNKDQYSNNLYNQTWQTTFIGEYYNYDFFSRIWYHTGQQPYYRTQSGKAFIINNELSIVFDSLSEQGKFMDHKMRRIWPTNINEYNSNLSSVSKNSASSLKQSTLPNCEGSYNERTWTNCYGIYKWSNTNSKYEGEFLNGDRHGFGSFFYSNGDKYIGEFKNDRINGMGSVFFASGAKYIGELKNGKRHGQGTYIYSDGKRLKGTWNENEYVDSKNYRKVENENTNFYNKIKSSSEPKSKTSSSIKEYWWVLVLLAGVIFFVYTQTKKDLNLGTERSFKSRMRVDQNIILSFFNGQKSLGFSFWIMYSLFNLINLSVFSILDDYSANQIIYSSISGIFAWVVIFYYIFSSIAAWRSATNYKFEKIRNRETFGWAIVTYVTISALSILLGIGFTQGFLEAI